MVMVGIDAHKRTHTFVATDELGRQLGVKTVAATPAGHREGLGWARQWPRRVFAVEDCRHVTRGLESDLLRAGEALRRVPTQLMAGARRGGRQRGKSDPIDALAVARAALREPDLPTARLDGQTRRVRLLVDHREDLVKERARIQNRLRWHLHELFPGLEIPALGLTRYRIIDDLEGRLAHLQGPVAEISAELVRRCRELTRRINELQAQITAIVQTLAPSLLTVPGCGVLTAAKILGETAGVGRFRSKAAFARWNGTAPVPVWSGNDDRHRLNRGGNRQVNAALHRIAITQWRGVGEHGRTYIQTRITQGHTKTEAIRLLRRRLSDVVYRSLLTDEHTTNTTTPQTHRAVA